MQKMDATGANPNLTDLAEIYMCIAQLRPENWGETSADDMSRGNLHLEVQNRGEDAADEDTDGKPDIKTSTSKSAADLEEINARRVGTSNHNASVRCFIKQQRRWRRPSRWCPLGGRWDRQH